MSDQYESIRDIGTRLHEIAATVKDHGVSAATASALENSGEGLRALAVAQRQALQAAEQLAAAEAGDA